MQLSYISYASLEKNYTSMVVFLHGLAGCASLWKPYLRNLREDWVGVAVDQRGHGDSEVSVDHQGFRAIDYAQDILETLAELQNLYKVHKVFLVGHSMGVRTALAAASLEPSLFHGLLLLDLDLSKTPESFDILEQFIHKIPPTFPSREEAWKILSTLTHELSLVRYVYAGMLSQPMKTLDAKIRCSFNRDAILKTITAARNEGPLEKPSYHLQTLVNRAPMLNICILRGEHSTMWDYASFLGEQERFRSFSQLSWQVVPNTTHGLPFEDRASVFQALYALDSSI